MSRLYISSARKQVHELKKRKFGTVTGLQPVHGTYDLFYLWQGKSDYSVNCRHPIRVWNELSYNSNRLLWKDCNDENYLHMCVNILYTNGRSVAKTLNTFTESVVTTATTTIPILYFFIDPGGMTLETICGDRLLSDDRFVVQDSQGRLFGIGNHRQ
jgi:hypothetical protein